MALTPTEERNWAMGAHLGAILAAWVAMGFLAPLIVMLAAGERSAFVRRHAVESLNFQISLLIYYAAAFVAGLLTLGIGFLIIIPVGLVAGVGALVFIVLATVAASRGEEYRYPLTIRLVH
ncbi:MAG: DUF4870 domain-containing protein [Mycobacteriales bacterium]